MKTSKTKTGFKNVRARRIWRGKKFAPVVAGSIFNFNVEFEGTNMTSMPLPVTWNESASFSHTVYDFTGK